MYVPCRTHAETATKKKITTGLFTTPISHSLHVIMCLCVCDICDVLTHTHTHTKEIRAAPNIDRGSSCSSDALDDGEDESEGGNGESDAFPVFTAAITRKQPPHRSLPLATRTHVISPSTAMICVSSSIKDGIL